MEAPKPLTCDQLHQIGVRRRGDPDVRTLLLEIKRLRDLTLEAYRRGSHVLGYTDDPHEAYLREGFGELFENEPAILEAMARPRQPQPPGPSRRWPHMSEEREAKLLARMQRG